MNNDSINLHDAFNNAYLDVFHEPCVLTDNEISDILNNADNNYNHDVNEDNITEIMRIIHSILFNTTIMFVYDGNEIKKLITTYIMKLYMVMIHNSYSHDEAMSVIANYSKLFSKIVKAEDGNTPFWSHTFMRKIGHYSMLEHIDYINQLIQDNGINDFITAFKDYDDCYQGFNESLMVNSDINYMPLIMKTGFKYAYLTYSILNENIQIYDDANNEQHVYKNAIKFNYTKFHLTRSTAVKLMCDVHDELMEANNRDLTEANKAYHEVLDSIVNMINEDMIYDKRPTADLLIEQSQYPIELLHETVIATHFDDIDKRKYMKTFGELCRRIGPDNLLALFKINRDEKGGYHLMKSCTQSFMHKSYPILRKMNKTVNDDGDIAMFLRRDFLKHGHIPNNKAYISRVIDAGFVSLTLNNPLDATNIKNELTACDYIYDNTERFYRFVIMQFIRGFIMKRESDALVNRRMPIFDISSIRDKHNYDYLNESGVKQFIDTGILPASLKEPVYPIEYDRNNNIITKEYEIPSEMQDVINNIMPASYAEYHKLYTDDKIRLFKALMEAFMKTAKTNEKYKKAWIKASRYWRY